MSAGGKWQGQDRTPRLPACAAPCGPLSRPCCRDTKRMSPVPPTFPGRLTPARISSRVCATALRSDFTAVVFWDLQQGPARQTQLAEGKLRPEGRDWRRSRSTAGEAIGQAAECPALSGFSLHPPRGHQAGHGGHPNGRGQHKE